MVRVDVVLRWEDQLLMGIRLVNSKGIYVSVRVEATGAKKGHAVGSNNRWRSPEWCVVTHVGVEEIVRPRRLRGASGWPLNFTVRLPRERTSYV